MATEGPGAEHVPLHDEHYRVHEHVEVDGVHHKTLHPRDPARADHVVVVSSDDHGAIEAFRNSTEAWIQAVPSPSEAAAEDEADDDPHADFAGGAVLVRFGPVDPAHDLEFSFRPLGADDDTLAGLELGERDGGGG